MSMIDYKKYSNMNERQLLNSLLNARKKEQKIKAEAEKKINETKELIQFLKAKVKESLDKPKQNFEPLKQTESYKQFQKMKAQMTEQEKQELEAELQKEMNRDYSYEL